MAQDDLDDFRAVIVLLTDEPTLAEAQDRTPLPAARTFREWLAGSGGERYARTPRRRLPG